MVFSKNVVMFSIVQAALIVFQALLLLAQAQDQSGFISIDCGISGVTSYTDEKTGISYVSDSDFTEFGENKGISPTYKGRVDEQQFWNVRSFPQGTRNCYTLGPTLGKSTTYLVRARFKYGNYDNENQSPTFQLYLGVDLWDTVIITNPYTIINKGIVYVPTSNRINVCLVNTGFGVPFISVLELRPFGDEIYASEKGSALNLLGHFDFSAANDQYMRYKDDIYDRTWSSLPTNEYSPFLNATVDDVDSISKNEYAVPFTVMRTAYTPSQGVSSLQLDPKDLDSSSTYFFYLHFAELEVLQQNESREFNIYINENLWNGPFSPRYLKTDTKQSSKGLSPNSEGKLDIWLNNTASATLPPLINAAEVYALISLSGEETNQEDVEAISDVKLLYGLKRPKWQGDPCGPEAYLWDGLDCSYKPNNPSRIVSLNLSSSGLTGGIAPSISNLAMLEYLDLSDNNLTGTVPESLARLLFLKVLNLKGNKFTGLVPKALMSNKGLQLSVDTYVGNNTSCLMGSCKKKKGFVVPLVASLVSVLLVVLVLVFAIRIVKRRRQNNATDMQVETVSGERNEEEGQYASKNQQFTYSEIQKITNNFQNVLGEGGFGKVYHGYLNDKEVAVKMLCSSTVQGQRQFHAELKLLLRVHHKNLTSLVGYCNEETNIGLIYEYMANGNLRSHLSGTKRSILTWEERLRIAIDAAQGLEYLHNGCKPPIIHRDVKTTNILLDDKFQAKLGDFGLSKIFPLEGGNRTSTFSTPGITTSIAGTLGYLDPEYYRTNWLNEKSDVYSFGVVLLEIITARPVLTKTREDSYIVQWVSSVLTTGDIKNIIDAKMEGGCDINSVWKTIEVAMHCVSKTSAERPTMSQVTAELKDCLTSELGRKNSRDVADLSKDSSVEMISRTMVSQFSPDAR